MTTRSRPTTAGTANSASPWLSSLSVLPRAGHDQLYEMLGEVTLVVTVLSRVTGGFEPV